MSVKVIDKKNPIFLLENYNVKRVKSKETKGKLNNISIDGNAFVILTHFNTLYKNPNDLIEWQSFLCTKNSSDIIHSTVGLLDVCLPDMDLGTIYNSTVDKEAYTIIMLSSKNDSLERLKMKLSLVKDKHIEVNKLKSVLNQDKFTEEIAEESDIFISAEEKEDDFKFIYEDFESEDEEEEDQSSEEEEEPDFSKGYNSYIRTVYLRKLNNLQCSSSDLIDVGFENQIIGSISFKIRYVDMRRIVHITLLGVHKLYRCAGIGRQLTDLVLNQSIVGQYEAVVVHADFSASEFFKKFGFSDDILLNTQWHTLEPEYTNCSLLTFVPPYSGKLSRNDILANEFSSAEMDVDVKLWQKKSVELHCFQLHSFQKMKMEIMNLKETIKNQDRMMKMLMIQLRESNREKCRYERFLKATVGSDGNILNDTFLQSSEAEEEVSSIIGKSQDDIENKIKAHFKEASRPSGDLTMHFVSFKSVFPSSIVQAEYQATKRSIEIFLPKRNKKLLNSTRLLYFCEPSSLHQDSKSKILSEGFTKNNKRPGSHGNGLYFATNPATAAIYSNSCNIIVAEVILGKIYDQHNDITPQIDVAPNGYHSVLSSSSLLLQANNNAADIFEQTSHNNCYFPGEEFVIFDAAQALPLGLVTYETLGS